jgi:hypothetical protein
MPDWNAVLIDSMKSAKIRFLWYFVEGPTAHIDVHSHHHPRSRQGIVMIVRDLSTAKTVDWGNGLSRRFLLEADGLGYTVTDTIVRGGTSSRLEYKRHLETCYCIAGRGEVIDSSGKKYSIEPGMSQARFPPLTRTTPTALSQRLAKT